MGSFEGRVTCPHPHCAACHLAELFQANVAGPAVLFKKQDRPPRSEEGRPVLWGSGRCSRTYFLLAAIKAGTIWFTSPTMP
ncbi:hypothetical protein GCM10010840_01240 [Deinococcus aerolatus]|uniref:Uncharacterized protein n=1 Tax=Deinococcus aerolatus TaxID=522487 RepID=A0ABQ2FZ09_9DEIO|nr:hypothetical protein GCM10010840_01240 [Deinococcus aerolatus]